MHFVVTFNKPLNCLGCYSVQIDLYLSSTIAIYVIDKKLEFDSPPSSVQMLLPPCHSHLFRKGMSRTACYYFLFKWKNMLFIKHTHFSTPKGQNWGFWLSIFPDVKFQIRYNLEQPFLWAISLPLFHSFSQQINCMKGSSVCLRTLSQKSGTSLEWPLTSWCFLVRKIQH